MRTTKLPKKVSAKNILNPGSNLKDRFIEDYSTLKDLVRQFKDLGYRIVLAQGVYDLIHQGHALYLESAKQLGDILIVGVDSDELTKRRKGPDRPVVPENERIKMLVHLRHVDIVTLRHAHYDIGDLIRVVEPDILVLSTSTKDFLKEDAKMYESCCGEIVTLPPQATTSTTARIRTIAIEGARRLSREIAKLTEEFIEKIKDSK